MLPSYILLCKKYSSIRISIKIVRKNHFKVVKIFHHVQHTNLLSSHRHPLAPEIHASVHATTRGKRNIHAATAMAFVAAVLFVVVRVAEAGEVI
jgi:hypothetical protein